MLNNIKYFHNMILIVTLELRHIWCVHWPLTSPVVTQITSVSRLGKGSGNREWISHLGISYTDAPEFMSVASRMSIHGWVTTYSVNNNFLTPWVFVLELHSKFQNASKKNWNRNNINMFCLHDLGQLWKLCPSLWWTQSQVTLAPRTRANTFPCLKYIAWSRKLLVTLE